MVWESLLKEGDRVLGHHGFDTKHLQIHSEDVLSWIRSGDSSREAMVPPLVAEAIKSKRLLGYRG
jgi:hypothetical protein